MNVIAAAFLSSLIIVNADSGDDCPCCDAAGNDPSPDWINYGGIVFILIIVVAMFWALATVCEEFFVPALNVLCEEWKIPDDVAGATFMAAGASSPELFTSFIGLIVYNSNIGVGTVVGSEIFNHMIISAGSVLFAKDGTLYLDVRIICRDLFFYMVSMLVLIYSLKNEIFHPLTDTFNASSWDECLSVTTIHGAALVLLYCVYAAVAGNYQRLVSLFCPREEISDGENDSAKVFNVDDSNSSNNISGFSHMSEVTSPSFKDALRPSTSLRPSLSQLNRSSFTPLRSSWMPGARDSMIGVDVAPRISDLSYTRMRPSELVRLIDGQHKKKTPAENTRGSMYGAAAGNMRGSTGVFPGSSSIHSPLLAPTAEEVDALAPLSPGGTDVEETNTREELKRHFFPIKPLNLVKIETKLHEYLEPNCVQSVWNFLIDAELPEDVAVMHRSDDVCKGYLFVYEDCIGLDALPVYMSWQLRFVSVDQHGFHYTSSPADPATGRHVQIVDLSTATSVTVEDRNTLHFSITFANDVVKKIQFRATSDECMEVMVQRITRKIEEFRPKVERLRGLFAELAQEELWEEGDDTEHEHSLLTCPRGRYAMWWHLVVFPLKAIFHYTLVDCREAKYRTLYGRMVAICVFYLASLSYIMILCCNYIGDYIGASPTVMGLTLSAVGTSFPNLWSSMVVARQGYGNMAICNALGSNIFNVNIALGLPWLVFLLIRNGNPYDEMQDNGIVMFVVFLEAVSVVWFAMISFSGFQMKAWMAPVFILIYFVILVAAVGLS